MDLFVIFVYMLFVYYVLKEQMCIGIYVGT